MYTWSHAVAFLFIYFLLISLGRVLLCIGHCIIRIRYWSWLLLLWHGPLVPLFRFQTELEFLGLRGVFAKRDKMGAQTLDTGIQKISTQSDGSHCQQLSVDLFRDWREIACTGATAEDKSGR